jgi:hypothetical protein
VLLSTHWHLEVVEQGNANSALQAKLVAVLPLFVLALKDISTADPSLVKTAWDSTGVGGSVIALMTRTRCWAPEYSSVYSAAEAPARTIRYSYSPAGRAGNDAVRGVRELVLLTLKDDGTNVCGARVVAPVPSVTK